MSERRLKWRALMTSMHRYVGLAIASFLVIAGLTGSVLAFRHEIDAWLNPSLFDASEGESLSVSELVARFEQHDVRARVTQVTLPTGAGMPVVLSVTARRDESGQRYALDYSQAFLDPPTARVLGTRLAGACCLERENLLGFIYDLHFTLHMPGLWGTWLLGVVSIAWLLDSFVGFYLTLPAGAAKAFSADYWRRWKMAWKIKTSAGTARINYDFHRASGLWLWGVLFVLALSSIKLNLDREVFRPIVSMFSPLTPSIYDVRGMDHDPQRTPLSFDEIQRVALAEAQLRTWTEPLAQIYHGSAYGLYGARFGDENTAGLGRKWLYFDDRDGRLIGDAVPGAGTAGDFFSEVQLPLHSGKIIGLPGRILICLAGLVVAALSITGVVIWLRKRRPRRRGV